MLRKSTTVEWWGLLIYDMSLWSVLFDSHVLSCRTLFVWTTGRVCNHAVRHSRDYWVLCFSVIVILVSLDSWWYLCFWTLTAQQTTFLFNTSKSTPFVEVRVFFWLAFRSIPCGKIFRRALSRFLSFFALYHAEKFIAGRYLDFCRFSLYTTRKNFCTGKLMWRCTWSQGG